MDNIHHGKGGGWIAPVGVLLCLMAVITAQPGFLTISCGGKTNYTENNITWVTDADYIDVGETADIGNATKGAYGSYLRHLRLFPKPLNKSCYQLPVAPDVPYLLRLWFAVGNYNGFKKFPSFAFSIETPGLLAMVPRTTPNKEAFYEERIFVSSGTVLYICLIRTSESDDPFISAIELRTFQDGMYAEAKPGTMLWPGTYDVGGKSTIRYPQDKFDRIWTDGYLNAQSTGAVSSQEAISTHNTKDLPPTAVMQTASLGSGSEILVSTCPQGSRSLLLLYFAEIEKFNMSKSRSFYVEINVDALHSIKMSFDIKDWISDPCYLIRWKGIGCDNSSLATRISEINLSGRNLAGSMPNVIGQLTALVNLSLENNHLIGTFPNLSNLTMLERLYLQNNNLSGSVPEWLTKLKNLKELNIENNNFSCAIPAQLLLNCSLKFNYSGNRYLRMDKRECTLKNSNNNKLKVVLGTTLSGILIVTLALIAGIVVYVKKLRRKEDGVTTNSTGVEREPKPFLYQGQ